MNRERHGNAMFIVSGYSMLVYCQYCLSYAEFTYDGPNCYYVCRRLARKKDWILHKDGYCTCKDCK